MKDFVEKFVSPFEKDTKDEAYRVLEAVRAAHPASSGWEEIHGYVEQRSNGKWRAVRLHKKVRSA